MNHLVSRIIGALRVLSTPSCWMQNHRYSAEWDRQLRALMTEHKFVPLGPHTARLGPLTLWTSNHPYASFHPYHPLDLSVRASRITMLRAGDKYMADIVAHLSLGAEA